VKRVVGLVAGRSVVFDDFNRRRVVRDAFDVALVAFETRLDQFSSLLRIQHRLEFRRRVRVNVARFARDKHHHLNLFLCSRVAIFSAELRQNFVELSCAIFFLS
jgi:hypothetical protein